MYRTIAFFLLCFSCLLWADNNAQKLSLSLEECLTLAEQESLIMLRAESARQKLDFAVISQWLNYIPDLRYDLESSYDETSQLDDNTPVNHTAKLGFRHALSFSQRLFGQRLIDLFTNEKNEKIQREIIALSFRSALSYIVREAYYTALIYTEKIQALGTVQEFITG